MDEQVASFMKRALEKDRVILNSIYNDIITKYSHESRRQHAIRAVFTKFEHDFPKVMSEFDSEIKKKKELSINKYSSNYDNTFRKMFAMPDGIMARISQLFDKIGEKEDFLNVAGEQDWFAREFPRYLVPEVY